MKESPVRHFLILVQVIFLMAGCAKTSTPSGGPKDKEAPFVTKSVPLNGSINFKGKEIVVSFNEYVVLDKINEKFMVSPPVGKKPQILIRGKSIHIEFNEKLKDSTTYTLNFQDAIRDLNEGNPINNYQFVFSTGHEIDSLSVTGNVYNALNLNAPENTIVLLYSNMADSFVVRHLPDYITRSEKNGEFRINNIKQGNYRLYALKDGDNSKTYNNRDEEFSFYPATISITPEKNFLPVIKDTAEVKPAVAGAKIPTKPPVKGEYQLILFQAEKKSRYLTSSGRKQPYQLTYTLSLPPVTMKFDFSIPGASANKYFIQNSRNRDSVTVWLTDSAIYNRPQILTIVKYPFTDSLGITGPKSDSIQMRYLAPRPSRAKIPRRNPFKVSNGIISGQARPDRQIIVFSAPSPFLPPDTAKLRFYEIVKESKFRVPFMLTKDSANLCRYYMKTEIKPGSSYLLISDSAAFKNIYGDSSDSTGTKFTVQTPEMFGNLTLDIKNHDGNRIIQLLDPSEKTVREARMKTDGKLVFPLIEKGNYRLRAIFDLNEDGKWTTGDFTMNRQPEPVSYYPSEIEIKENWNLIQTWDLAQKNYKDFKLTESGKSEQTGRTKQTKNINN